MAADMPPFEIAKLWIDLSNLERLVFELELIDPPSVVMDRVVSRLSVLNRTLQPLKRNRANSPTYRHAMNLVCEELRIVSLLFQVWSKHRKNMQRP
jgi:hypothetical protein